MPDQRQWDIRFRPTEGFPSRLHEDIRILTDLLSPMVSISSSFLIANRASDLPFILYSQCLTTGRFQHVIGENTKKAQLFLLSAPIRSTAVTATRRCYPLLYRHLPPAGTAKDPG